MRQGVVQIKPHNHWLASALEHMMSAVSIFLSHNKEDKDFARRLANDLRRAGITVWIDEAEIGIGNSIIGEIEKGLIGSDYLGVVLSPTSVSSTWVQEELRSVLHNQLTKQNKIVLTATKTGDAALISKVEDTVGGTTTLIEETKWVRHR